MQKLKLKEEPASCLMIITDLVSSVNVINYAPRKTK